MPVTIVEVGVAAHPPDGMIRWRAMGDCWQRENTAGSVRSRLRCAGDAVRDRFIHVAVDLVLTELVDDTVALEERAHVALDPRESDLGSIGLCEIDDLRERL